MIAFWRFVWRASERANVPLGRFAPYVLGKAVGTIGVKVVSIEDTTGYSYQRIYCQGSVPFVIKHSELKRLQGTVVKTARVSMNVFDRKQQDPKGCTTLGWLIYNADGKFLRCEGANDSTSEVTA